LLRIFVFSIALVCAIGCTLAPAARDQATPAEMVKQFRTSPTQGNWSGLSDSVRRDYEEPNSKKFLAVLAYHQAREHRDLPNSMALKGMSADEFVAQQGQIADRNLATLKLSQDESLWNLLDGMARQEFDESLTWTAAELLYRLSPSRFDASGTVVASQSEKQRIFRETRERWSGGR
jgi:hypothetical protein